MDNDFSLLEVFFSMLYFFLFIAWIYLLVMIASDIFRSRDLGNWAKALWILFLVIVPIIGSLAYLIVRGHTMAERQRGEMTRQEDAFRSYVQDAARGSTSTADEIEKLAQLRNAGTITPIEQELNPSESLERLLTRIEWPPAVRGAAAVVERIVIPGEADASLPEGAEADAAANHPLRQEVRMAAAVTRDGRVHCAIRLRSHDRDDAVLDGDQLAPGLVGLLARSLTD